MNKTYWCYGHWLISEHAARKLQKNMRFGYEYLVQVDGAWYWLKRAVKGGELVWTIMETNWRMVDGRAVLSLPF